MNNLNEWVGWFIELKLNDNAYERDSEKYILTSAKKNRKFLVVGVIKTNNYKDLICLPILTETDYQANQASIKISSVVFPNISCVHTMHYCIFNVDQCKKNFNFLNSEGIVKGKNHNIGKNQFKAILKKTQSHLKNETFLNCFISGE